MSEIRDEIEKSAPFFESKAKAVGEPHAYRERIREMSRNGDLYMLGKAMNAFARGHADSILSAIPNEACALERGALIGLRNFWWSLLRLGEDDLPVEVPVAEINPFTQLSELDRP